MQIDSARELKAFCLKQHIEPMISRPRTLGVAARAMSVVDPTQRTVALGITRKQNDSEYQLAVRIQSRGIENSRHVHAIIEAAKGEAEVRYVGRVVKRVAWNQTQQRPLLIGISIGHFKITAGTLGCFAKSRVDGKARILSNNHVLANENAAKAGDAILQPGAYDGGTLGDTVGQLDQFVPLVTKGANTVDAAIASLSPGIQYDSATLTKLGSLQGTAGTPVEIGDAVCKIGRKTDLTQGRVSAIEVDNVIIGYDLGNLRFDNQIEIESAANTPFSQGGDSGSLIVNSNLQAVGLLFAGSDQGGANGQGITYANPIGTVFDALAVDLLY
jgi:hypothetical protein